MRSPRTRSLPAQSPDPVPLPASGPFDPGLIHLKGRRGLGFVLLNPPLGRRRDTPPLLPPVTLQGILERSGHFFALLLPFWLRLPGFSLIVPKGRLPLPQDN